MSKKQYRIDISKLIVHKTDHVNPAGFEDVTTGRSIGFPLGTVDIRKNTVYAFSLLAELQPNGYYELVRLFVAETTGAGYPEVTREDGKPLVTENLIIVGIRTAPHEDIPEALYTPEGALMLSDEYEIRQNHSHVKDFMEMALDSLVNLEPVFEAHEEDNAFYDPSVELLNGTPPDDFEPESNTIH